MKDQSIKIVPYAGNAAHSAGDLVRFKSGAIYRVGKNINDGVSWVSEKISELAEDNDISFSTTLPPLPLPPKWEDVVVPEVDVKRLRSYSHNDETFAHYLNGEKIRRYIDAHLKRVESLSSTKNLGRCWTCGTDVYVRRDGKPVNSEDLIAVQNNVKGQVNRAKFIEPVAPAGFMMIERYFECDSSD